MPDCRYCKNAIMDYEEYCYGCYMRRWFVDDCEKGLDISDVDCPEFEEWRDSDA